MFSAVKAKPCDFCAWLAHFGMKLASVWCKINIPRERSLQIYTSQPTKENNCDVTSLLGMTICHIRYWVWATRSPIWKEKNKASGHGHNWLGMNWPLLHSVDFSWNHGMVCGQYVSNWNHQTAANLSMFASKKILRFCLFLFQMLGGRTNFGGNPWKLCLLVQHM